MASPLSRREFLKLSGLLSVHTLLPTYFLKPGAPAEVNSNKDNVLLIVFDAWSASNTSLFGYGRKTTPYLERLAEKAVVYHNHFAGGNFTTPGTASLLTGAHPWSHRAFILNTTVREDFAHQNIFQVFTGYNRIAYTHNPITDTLLTQFMPDIDAYLPMHHLYLEKDFLIDVLFAKDRDAAAVSVNRALKQKEDGFAYSLYLSRLYENYLKGVSEKRSELNAAFPRGVPNYDGLSYFTLEEGINGVLESIGDPTQPFLGYYHFLPPHNPYKTRVDFFNRFVKDGHSPVGKEDHLFAKETNAENIDYKRRLYDEFILYVDSEFARLYAQMESSGLLDDTWLILTSDHGEMFERGILGHMTPSLHQPVIHVPLVIFPPGQQTRVDIDAATSAVDLLPTLCQVTGQQIPVWAEGKVLPPFSASPSSSNQDVFALQASSTGENTRITIGTVMLVRGQYKLTWYFGYEKLGQEGELVELYDLSTDPEELQNLALRRPDLVETLLKVAKSKLEEMDRPA